MLVTKASHTFYFTFALLKASKYYLSDLIAEKEVSMSLKRDFRIIINRITDLEKTALNHLAKRDSETWAKEWSDRDFQVFASVFSIMNDLDEERRLMLEQFAKQLQGGEIKAEAA